MNPDPIDTFRNEAADLLENLELALLDLERRPDDHKLISDAFRALHTLKGSGAMFGFDEVATFTHEFETAFDRLRKSGVPASPELVGAALAAKDHIRALIENPGGTDAVFGEAILSELRELAGSADAPGAAITGPAPSPGAASAAGQRRYRIVMKFSPSILVNGANPLALLDDLRALGPCVATPDMSAVPSLDEMDPAQCYVNWTVDLRTEASRETIESVFEFVRDEMQLEIAEHGAEERGARASAKRAPDAKTDESAGQKTADRAAATVRVQAERLDRLMDRVGELVIAQARLTQVSDSRRDVALQSVAEEIERLVGGLRDTAMGMRMVPIGSLFGRFRRLVHDLSRDLDKPVELVTSGEETELDKTVIERLADPLVHLIRNAIDHGLEDRTSRSASEKSAVGVITLTAGHVGAEVHITIADDGRGIDAGRLRAKAEELGLLQPGAPATDAELFDFMFMAGFSTAASVSALSGRGVGMDVVKTTIESLRGKIDVASTPGEGTRFTLRLPLTLAIIDGLLVRVADGRYIIPLSAVEECVELSRGVEERSGRRSFLNVRGDLVPFLRLRDQFRLEAGDEPYPKVVIVRAGDARIGLVVDQIVSSQQVVIKSLSRLHSDVRAFSGATILGDGLPALILDIAQLVHSGETRHVRERELIQ